MQGTRGHGEESRTGRITHYSAVPGLGAGQGRAEAPGSAGAAGAGPGPVRRAMAPGGARSCAGGSGRSGSFRERPGRGGGGKEDEEGAGGALPVLRVVPALQGRHHPQVWAVRGRRGPGEAVLGRGVWGEAGEECGAREGIPLLPSCGRAHLECGVRF